MLKLGGRIAFGESGQGCREEGDVIFSYCDNT